MKKKVQSPFLDFILKEWLLITSGVGLVVTSIGARRLPAYSFQDFEVLFVLWILFVSVQGLNNSGLITYIAQKIEQGTFISFKLVLSTFFLSMVVTNDVALIVIVPLTLLLPLRYKGLVVILEAMAANAGSALTPFGNPQNLFIYWSYNLSFGQFVGAIAPFSLTFLVVLGLGAFLLSCAEHSQKKLTFKFFSAPNISFKACLQGIKNVNFDFWQAPGISKKAWVYLVLVIFVLLIVLHVLPLATGLIVVFFALLWDVEALKVDYSLLVSFFFFFGFSDNIKLFLPPSILSSKHVFLFSALASQLISNVPAALLFSNFTSNWLGLLWGVNAGGFGSLLGSLANLIAYKIYITRSRTKDLHLFTLQFFILGYVAFFISFGLYFLFMMPR
ncbi:MAG: SLC13 family permease [Desulfonauticus sp.]|nr:SLC13 family permease [Desulfonauticus sp.]